MNILIVEDEQLISDLIYKSLTAANYFCTCAEDGLKAADLLERNQYDLILLDILLPEIDGYELMDYIRPMGIPVIFISAKANVEDRVKGLKLGADDYLTKPFELIELLARVESVLRRNKKIWEEVMIDNLHIDIGSRTVKKSGKEIPLTKKEYELLLLFVQNKNIALFRDTIYERIWGNDYQYESRTVDLHVQRLRKKIGWEDKIKAVYKVGYRLETSE